MEDFSRRLLPGEYPPHSKRGTNGKNMKYGSVYRKTEEAYKRIYTNLLWSIVCDLIKYDNAPDTLDQNYLEFELRMYGYARVGGLKTDDIHVIGQPDDANGGENGFNPTLGVMGFLSDDTEIMDYPEDPNSPMLNYIYPGSWQDLEKAGKGGYVDLMNKYDFFTTSNINVGTDKMLIDQTARDLATIKANERYNLLQMKRPFIGFTTDKNLSAQNIYNQIIDGYPIVQVDSSLNDISQVVQIISLDVPNFLPDLQQAWQNVINEFLTFLGINTVGVEKAERVNVQETNANAQFTEAAANTYLDARNRELKLLNHVFGLTKDGSTEIQAVFNQETYADLVQLAETNPQNGKTDPNLKAQEQQSEDEET